MKLILGIVGILGLLAVVGGFALWIAHQDGPSRRVLAGPVDPDPQRSSLRLEPGGNGFGLSVDESGVWVLTGTVSATEESWSAVHVDPTGRELLARIPLPASPIDIATGAGAVWVTTLNQRDRPLYGALLRIDPATDSVTGTLPLEVAGGLAVTDEAVWVTAPRLGSLYRIDPRSMELVATIENLGATAVTAAFDRVWVTDVHGGKLVGVDPTSNQVVSTTAIGELPAWISATTLSLWAIVQQPPTVVAINPGRPDIATTVSVPARIVAMTAEADNAWVGTNEPGTEVGTIYRIDAASYAIEEFDAFDSKPTTDLAVNDDVLWGVTYLDGELVRASIKR